LAEIVAGEVAYSVEVGLRVHGAEAVHYILADGDRGVGYKAKFSLDGFVPVSNKGIEVVYFLLPFLCFCFLPFFLLLPLPLPA